MALTGGERAHAQLLVFASRGIVDPDSGPLPVAGEVKVGDSEEIIVMHQHYKYTSSGGGVIKGRGFACLQSAMPVCGIL